jgi:hypothetical protein
MSQNSKPTEQELHWARNLKTAAQSPDSGVDAEKVSDFEFLQHAIIAKTNTAKALQRLRHLQAFKRRYGILGNGSVDEAERDLRTFLSTHPKLYLSLADSGEHDNKTPATQIFCSEYRYFNASRMKSEEAYLIYMRAAFYTLQASQCSVAALRAGLVLLMDVHGALRYRSFQTEARARELYGKAYPIRIQGVVLLRSGMTLRMAYKWLLRPWLSRKVKELLQMPEFTNEQDYSESCGVSKASLPKCWGGDLDVDDFHQTIITRLRQRYQMEEIFRL